MKLARNSLFNLFGALLPAIAALVTVPVIISRLGEVQYGVLALVTSIVGYFAILDINVSAGSIKYLAEYQAKGDRIRSGEVLTFGGMLYLAIGAIGCCAIFAFAGNLVDSVFAIPASLHDTATVALRIAAVAFLVGQIVNFLQSIIQALHRFDVSGKLESVFGTLASLSTVAVVLAGGGLVEVVAARLVLSAVNGIVLVRQVQTLMPDATLRKPSRTTVRELLSFSAFSYLNRIAAITYLNADKLLIGVLADMRSLSFYTIPFLLVNRVFAMIYRLGQVIFPATSAMAAEGNLDRLRRTYLIATRYLVFLNAALCLMLALFAHEILHYWVGATIATPAAGVLFVIAVAVFVDSLTNLPSLVNDGLGHPRFTGVFAILRASLGVAASWWAVREYGFQGAAWSLLAVSIVIGSGFLVFIHRITLPVSLGELVASAYRPTLLPLVVGLTLAGIRLGHPVLSLPEFALGVLLVGLALGAYGWCYVCLPDHRRVVMKRVRTAVGSTRGPMML